ncbi:hypothetical protein [Micromonospora sp. NPDC047527]|uniref:hypothetical protein n=1 Tax=unclassified Micromonospora TaxID=2617518 RepID=UPI0033C4EF1F
MTLARALESSVAELARQPAGRDRGGGPDPGRRPTEVVEREVVEQGVVERECLSGVAERGG